MNDEGSLIFGEPGSLADRTPTAVLSIDIPWIVDGRAKLPIHGGLSIVGWALSAGAALSIEIDLDGARITSARYGLRRPDVAAAHPQRQDALLSGYAAHLPPKALTPGHHSVMVSLHDSVAELARIEFFIDVHGVPDDHGPWALRRKITQAEIDAKQRMLSRLKWRPIFWIYLRVVGNAEGIAAGFRSIESLSRQAYADWRLFIALVPTTSKSKALTSNAAWLDIKRRIRVDFDPIADRIVTVESKPGSRPAKRPPPPSSGRACLVSSIVGGDEYGCDALLEFAVASGFDQSAEFLYSDERRPDPVDGKFDAFFKPGWSPDLHLSTNYVGRAWFAHSHLLDQVGISADQLPFIDDFALSLRLTEAAMSIGHVSRVLYQRGHLGIESPAEERRAVTAALERRNIDASVEPGSLSRHYRVKRHLVVPGKVSIIIPTCAANGLIERCLDTLRTLTTYRDYEIVCIENIPTHQQEWKGWVRSHADIAIETKKPFNWSQYNNQAVKRATGKYLLFLNDDTEVIDPQWLDALLEQVQRPEVGVVGPLLLYPNRSIQEAGVMLDGFGRGRHAFRHLSEHDPGYFGLALTQRNVISVTGACLMTRRETFDRLQGFDESNAVINNDLDYCLRARDSGLINVYTPHSRLIHHELASRSQLPEKYDVKKFHDRWRDVVANRDPYFNPHLSRDHEPFTIEREPVEIVYAGPLFAQSSVRRIVAFKLDHIGDCVTAIPAVQRLKTHFPKASITLVTARASLDLWRAEPRVHEVFEFNFFHARSSAGKIDVTESAQEKLGALLQSKKFDLAIDLRKQPDTRHLLRLSGAQLLAGFDAQGRFPWLDVALEWDEDTPLRKKHGHVTDDLIALVDAVAARGKGDPLTGVTLPEGHLPLPARIRRQLDAKPMICVHPAAGSPMRQWAPERFAELIALFLQRGRYSVVLIGGGDERTQADQVLRPITDKSDVIDMVGQLTLPQTMRLIARSVLFVGNNSGPHHLAASIGIPTVGIHSGVVDTREWAPSGREAVAVRRDMSCSPCYLERPGDCPRQLECLTGLAVADVYEICKQLLVEDGTPTPRGTRRRTNAKS